MSHRVRKDLLNYLEKGRGSSLELALILNRNGLRMSGESFNRTLKKLIERTDIQKVITLHSLRHSIATHLLESNLSIEKVRDFLGHKHLESTQIYTRIHEDI